MPQNPLHRIEPQLLTVPQFYGSPGEPSLGALPSVSGQTMRPPPQGVMGLPMGLPMGILALMAAGKAQTPNLPPYPQAPDGAMPQFSPTPYTRAPADDIMDSGLPFKQAFAKARKMGLVEFEWRGANYTTRYKEE